MNTNETILSLIRTQTEAHDLLVDLNEFVASTYSTKSSQLQDYFPKIQGGLRNEIIRLLSRPEISSNKESLRPFINELQDKIKACKNVKIALAFQPDDETITSFSVWIKKNIGSNILLDIEVNKDLVGGTVIIVGGQYKDYSVRKKLTQVFQIEKEQILSLLSTTH